MAIKSAQQSASPADLPAPQWPIRHHEPVSGGLAPRTSIPAIAGGYGSGARALSDISAAASKVGQLRPASFAPGSSGLSSLTGRHQLGHVVRIDHEFLGRSVMEDLICLDRPLQRDHLRV